MELNRFIGFIIFSWFISIVVCAPTTDERVTFDNQWDVGNYGWPNDEQGLKKIAGDILEVEHKKPWDGERDWLKQSVDFVTTLGSNVWTKIAHSMKNIF